MILILLGKFILEVILTILNYGDDVASQPVQLNRAVDILFRFPVNIFEEGYPLWFADHGFWSIKNLLLLFLTTAYQATGLYFFMQLMNGKLK